MAQRIWAVPRAANAGNVAEDGAASGPSDGMAGTSLRIDGREKIAGLRGARFVELHVEFAKQSARREALLPIARTLGDRLRTAHPKLLYAEREPPWGHFGYQLPLSTPHERVFEVLRDLVAATRGPFSEFFEPLEEAAD